MIGTSQQRPYCIRHDTSNYRRSSIVPYARHQETYPVYDTKRPTVSSIATEEDRTRTPYTIIAIAQKRDVPRIRLHTKTVYKETVYKETVYKGVEKAREEKSGGYQNKTMPGTMGAQPVLLEVQVRQRQGQQQRQCQSRQQGQQLDKEKAARRKKRTRRIGYACF